jgi:hypothetical protein
MDVRKDKPICKRDKKRLLPHWQQPFYLTAFTDFADISE